MTGLPGIASVDVATGLLVGAKGFEPSTLCSQSRIEERTKASARALTTGPVWMVRAPLSKLICQALGFRQGSYLGSGDEPVPIDESQEH